jgi:hypothetical protein
MSLNVPDLSGDGDGDLNSLQVAADCNLVLGPVGAKMKKRVQDSLPGMDVTARRPASAVHNSATVKVTSLRG